MIRIFLFMLLACPAFSQGFTDSQMLVDQINNARKRSHRKPLEYRHERQPQCDKWALKIRKSLIHNYSDSRLGEAISGVPAYDYIVPMFMGSDTHKRILLDKKATGICISVYQEPADTLINKNSVVYTPPLFYTVIRTY